MMGIILATAGHVDHGKTTLIKKLTGIDTDTTEEEKKRGLTINLGFAHLKLPNKSTIGIVDVPGHEKFLKNMLSGLSGIDAALLVVDPNEGVMPQTIEHARILLLLGVTKFIVVITKVDTVDKDMVELVHEDIKESFSGTPIEKAEFFDVDAVSGTGVTDLVQGIQKLCSSIDNTDISGYPRLNIDRSFSLKGIGTVVTGTLQDGNLSLDDKLILYPQEKEVNIKNIRVYEGNTTSAQYSTRTALNIALPSETFHRGDVLATPNTIEIVDRINVVCDILSIPDLDLKLNDRVRVYMGSKEVYGRIYPLGKNEIIPGETNFLQIRLEDNIAVRYQDKFILRSYSPIKVIGGGRVLEMNPTNKRRFDSDTLKRLEIRLENQCTDVVLEYFISNNIITVDKNHLSKYFNYSIEKVQNAIDELVSRKHLAKFGNEYLVIDVIENKNKEVLEFLDQYHGKYPLRKGIALAEIRSKYFKEYTESDFENFVNFNIEEKILKKEGSLLSRFEFKVELNNHQKKNVDYLLGILDKEPFIPQKINDVANSEELKELIFISPNDYFVNLDNEFVLSKKAFLKLEQKIIDYINKNEKLSLADYRDITKSSRRYAMIVLEKMDSLNITARKENYRVLGDKANVL